MENDKITFFIEYLTKQNKEYDKVIRILRDRLKVTSDSNTKEELELFIKVIESENCDIQLAKEMIIKLRDAINSLVEELEFYLI